MAVIIIASTAKFPKLAAVSAAKLAVTRSSLAITEA
jgi:hypothetical protein